MSYFLPRREVSFAEAFPTIESVTLTVSQEGTGTHATSWPKVYTTADLPKRIACLNDRCSNGGVDVYQFIDQAVELNWTNRKLLQTSCPGVEKSDCCWNRFDVEVEIVYKKQDA